MKIYDTKEEAMEAAEAWRRICELEIELSVHSDMVLLQTEHVEDVARFMFKPERVAPKKWQAVTDKKSGYVGYSLGTFSEGGLLRCCDDNEATTDSLLAVFTPVDIIPAGQFARAVELLEKLEIPVYNGYRGNPELSGNIKELLSEIEAGGE